jgi:RNA-directed DNA polymerase
VSTPQPNSFDISEEVVWRAYQRVKANQGAAGVDGETIEEFEKDIEEFEKDTAETPAA